MLKLYRVALLVLLSGCAAGTMNLAPQGKRPEPERRAQAVAASVKQAAPPEAVEPASPSAGAPS